MSELDKNIVKELEKDRFNEAKLIHKIFVTFSLIYLLFGLADYIYAPDRFVEFLCLRVLYTIAPISIYFFIDRTNKFVQTQYIAVVHASIASGIITYMIFSTSGVSSPYYAGLNLVGIITLCFFTFNWPFFILTAVSIYAPYYIFGLILKDQVNTFASLILNSFFIFGTILVSAVIHHFRERYRVENIKAKVLLRVEISNREEIIQIKTSEAVKLSVLSAQFSPQIIESIRTGKIKLQSGGNRTEICAMFIDIVNSTERVIRIDKDKVEKVLTKFLDDSVKIMLKYDLTIDKFLGDGILAFCNAPLKRVDFISRVVRAALEIRTKLKGDQDFFERYWMRHLDIRVGIAKGYVNVGFYGNQKYFRTYTAIGPVVNLASRLCSIAESNQIVCDFDVFEKIQSEFDTHLIGKKNLKGFDRDVIYVYEIKSALTHQFTGSCVSECPTCGMILTLETNNKGQYVFICKSCCTVIDT